MKFKFTQLEEIVGGIFLTATVLLVILNALSRKFFGISLSWAFEVATILFIWSTFIGASAAYKHNMHIGIDLLVKLTPKKLQKFVVPIVDLVMLIIVAYIFYLSIKFIQGTSKKTPVMNISSAWVSGSITVGFFLMTITAFKNLIRSFGGIFKPSQEHSKGDL